MIFFIESNNYKICVGFEHNSSYSDFNKVPTGKCEMK